MKKYLTICALMLFCFFLTSCDLEALKKYKNKAESEDKNIINKVVVIPVQAELPHRGDISDYFVTTTRILAENRVDVVPQAVTKCLEVRVEEGDIVKKGDVLAKLDEEEAVASRKQAEAVVRQRKSDYRRIKEGKESGVNSPAEFEAASYSLEQAEASLELQKINVRKHTIKAPINGTIIKKDIQPGAYATSGTPIFQIVDYTSLMLTINVPEKEIPRISKGQEARVTIDALGGEEFMARVRRINPSVDSTSGTVKVKLDFDEEVTTRLMESAFVRVQLVMETHKNALLVAKDSVVEENARKYLFVVKELEEEGEGGTENTDSKNKSEGESKNSKTEDDEEDESPKLIAEKIDVEIGLEDSNYVEIISGLDDSSLIVTLGQHSLKPNARVRISSFDKELEKNMNMSVKDALAEAKAAREKQKTDDSAFAHEFIDK